MKSKVLVDDESANLVLQQLTRATNIPVEAFKYEIQDDYQLLFITIASDLLSSSDMQIKREVVAKVMASIMPRRPDDYSWVVGFKQRGEVVESCFGGSLSTPDWGA